MLKEYFFVFAFLILIPFAGHPQNEADPGRGHCLTCHSRHDYTFKNPNTNQNEKRLMNPYNILDTVLIATGVHRHFKCTDCHSTDYEKWPHNGESKLEPINTCLDCHGGDETYAKFHFEEVDKEFQQSIHYTTSGDQFTCYKCHNPHYYRPMARDSKNMLESVAYDNNMCLSCHSNKDRFGLLSDKGLYDVMDRHEFLPNHTAHFRNVRCIECHTKVNDSLMVAHRILGKEKAVKLCVECHSSNSILMASLYKYQAKERRNELGFINASILNQSYVIGANRNLFLNILSLVIFGLVIAGIAGHSVLRNMKHK
jgi:hypothetical protein